MDYKITTLPIVEPVSLAEAKSHLRVDITADDELIETLIMAARQYCEGYLNRLLITQTVTVTYDNFEWLELPLTPIQSITSVKYYDSNNSQQALDSTDYQLVGSTVCPAYGTGWPHVRRYMDSVEVIYVAGYGDLPSDVPANIVAAVKLVLGHLYENRENTTVANLKTIPMSAHSLMSLDRRGIV